ncbi:sensor histidine kinase [Natronococcus jeotgali]|uniref:histidine kinase n=1 Tax=Natronococcus jeotgali DSM 18795 TaxID=1227498 RepID=L9XSU5_9EURY|nr:ATP-binding protein [Natronococcus jeotgali]ELY64602.1 integral membrane sensor signal transduction histidine kinase [Natronococcus jeotgali DSM 18795]
MTRWNRLLVGLGVLLMVGAGGSILYSLGHVRQPEVALLEVFLDAVLIGFPGVAMAYVGLRLPETAIPSEFYSRIVAWTGAGVAVMILVVGLRELHPGVDLDPTNGAQLILLSISSVTGLLVGVQDARTRTQARILEEQNAELRRKYDLERQNERLRRAERRLEEAVSELEASNERLEEFAYAVSHDLQEPLRMVTSYLELLEGRYDDELDDDGREFLEFAVDGAERMREMIDGLLAYSRVQTQANPLEAVDLEAVLEAVLDDLQFKIEERDADVASEPLPTVRGDESQLRQVFQNLLSNAIEYAGDEPPRIRIGARRRPALEADGADVDAGDDGAAWEISVSDDGIGIDPDDQERIFEIFQRLRASGAGSGSGIGLAICERIVERHGGEIAVDSAPGEGSTFRFMLPDVERASSARRLETGAATDR